MGSGARQLAVWQRSRAEDRLLELDIVNALNQLNEAVIKGIAPDRHSVMEFEAALDRGVAIVGGSGLQMRAHMVRRVGEIAHHTQTA